MVFNPKYAKIYKITNNFSDDIYVGSTALKYFATRKAIHKSICANKNTKLFKFVEDNGGWDNFKFEIIENYKCRDRQTLFKREQHYIKKLNPSLNMKGASFDKKKYQKEYMKSEAYKQYLNVYKKEYYLKNKEKQKAYQNTRYVKTKKDGPKLSMTDPKLYRKLYYQKNKEKLNRIAQEKRDEIKINLDPKITNH